MSHPPIHPHKKKIAVLIDAENVSHKLVDEIFDELALLGWVTHRRVYGDFSHPALAGWNAVAHHFALRQVMQRHNQNGKNSSDIVLVIDAMDILHAREVDALCIVSHDSDFTRLAMRIAEAGVEIIGMGERGKVGQSFVKACSDFRYIEDKNNGTGGLSARLQNNAESSGAKTTKAAKQPGAPRAKQPAASGAPQKAAAKEKSDAAKLLADTGALLAAVRSAAPQSGGYTRKDTIAFIKRALLKSPEEWLDIGPLGSQLHNRWPDFDPRHIGATGKQLSAFLKTLPEFETQEGKVRLKQTAAAV